MSQSLVMEDYIRTKITSRPTPMDSYLSKRNEGHSCVLASLGPYGLYRMVLTHPEYNFICNCKNNALDAEFTRITSSSAPVEQEIPENKRNQQTQSEKYTTEQLVLL